MQCDGITTELQCDGICDMGICRSAEKKTSEATKTFIGQLGMGAYPYMAPEMMQEHMPTGAKQ